ncbi:MAG: VWA domain-containing protein [Paludibacteraceae bacterium]|nr:VWA domain-containing protein [Paludibacteraceae bacterium]
MIIFQHPEYLMVGMAVILLLTIGFVMRVMQKRRQLRKLGDIALVQQLMPNVSTVRPILKFALLILALACITIVCARPQFGSRETTVKRSGIEVMIAVDVSNSMDAADVVPNRLTCAKRILDRMIDKLADDKVGIVVFAGDAFLQMPMTNDRVSAKTFLSNISTDMISHQGTAIGSAVNLCNKAFGDMESTASRTIVLITDGEDHKEDAVEAVQTAVGRGITLNVIGIGSPDGAPIPERGRANQYHKDREGKVVISKLNEQMCMQLAQAGNGVYLHAEEASNAARQITAELDKLAKSDIEQTVYSEYEEKFATFAAIALLILIIEFFIFGRKNKILTRLQIFSKRHV